jgi:hypothetical protein
VFFDEIKGPDGNPTPLIVRKSDGGYGYAATDLSAIRDRVFNLKATNLLYVVDVRQSLHFKMVFETARRAGWLNDDVTAYQLAFGTILGKDGKPFKTREGVSVKLEDLLDEAVQRATAVVRDKAEKVGLTEQEIVDNGRYVGIGAVKYADLSTSAVRDYKFDLDQMVSLSGDTSVYLQYAYARIQSILRKAGEARPSAHPELELAPAERALGLHLDQFSEVVAEAAKEYAPHKLTAYLYQLASTLTTFYDQCHVLSPDNAPEVVENRLFLVDLTARTLQRGMALLGIRTPEVPELGAAGPSGPARTAAHGVHAPASDRGPGRLAPDGPVRLRARDDRRPRVRLRERRAVHLVRGPATAEAVLRGLRVPADRPAHAHGVHAAARLQQSARLSAHAAQAAGADAGRARRDLVRHRLTAPGTGSPRRARALPTRADAAPEGIVSAGP